MEYNSKKKKKNFGRTNRKYQRVLYARTSYYDEYIQQQNIIMLFRAYGQGFWHLPKVAITLTRARTQRNGQTFQLTCAPVDDV